MKRFAYLGLLVSLFVAGCATTGGRPRDWREVAICASTCLLETGPACVGLDKEALAVCAGGVIAGCMRECTGGEAAVTAAYLKSIAPRASMNASRREIYVSMVEVEEDCQPLVKYLAERMIGSEWSIQLDYSGVDARRARALYSPDGRPGS